MIMNLIHCIPSLKIGIALGARYRAVGRIVVLDGKAASTPGKPIAKRDKPYPSHPLW